MSKASITPKTPTQQTPTQQPTQQTSAQQPTQQPAQQKPAQAKKVVVFGSTGSIGTSTLKVLESLGQEERVYGLVADSSLDALIRQAWQFRPKIIGLFQSGRYQQALEQALEKVHQRSEATGSYSSCAIGDFADSQAFKLRDELQAQDEQERLKVFKRFLELGQEYLDAQAKDASLAPAASAAVSSDSSSTASSAASATSFSEPASPLNARSEFVKWQPRICIGEQEFFANLDYSKFDQAMGAIVGFAGLRTSLKLLENGIDLLLANKESLVAGGFLIRQALLDAQARAAAVSPGVTKVSVPKVIPVDSEHNAIYQSLPLQVQQNLFFTKLADAGIESILLTGSGGPFRERALDTFSEITFAQASTHPNWDMGWKVTIDSSTMMNKGLEFIEAAVLFNARAEQIETVVHPQSLVHSGVTYLDGSLITQMGPTSMQVPIAYALSYPERTKSGLAPLKVSQLKALTFAEVEPARYPNFFLAKQALTKGYLATAALNAANEEVLAAFKAGKIGYTDIAKYNAQALALVQEPSFYQELAQAQEEFNNVRPLYTVALGDFPKTKYQAAQHTDAAVSFICPLVASDAAVQATHAADAANQVENAPAWTYAQLFVFDQLVRQKTRGFFADKVSKH